MKLKKIEKLKVREEEGKFYNEVYKLKLNRINTDYNFFYKGFKVSRIDVIWTNNYELYNRAELIMNILFFELFLGGRYYKTYILNSGEKREREIKRKAIKIYKKFNKGAIGKCLRNLIIFSTFLQQMEYEVKLNKENQKRVNIVLEVSKALSKFFKFKGSVPEIKISNLKISFQMKKEIKEVRGSERFISGLVTKEEEEEKKKDEE